MYVYKTIWIKRLFKQVKWVSKGEFYIIIKIIIKYTKKTYVESQNKHGSKML